MEINIITLFPQMFDGPLSESIIKRALKREIVRIKFYNLRNYAEDKRGTVDDTPYGGGVGMVLKVDVMDRAIKAIVKNNRSKYHTILMTPQGTRFEQDKAEELTKYDKIILICGHYEGFDERIREHLVDEEISLGDFVLSGGEIPAIAIVDSVIRLLPGALGKDNSSIEETFSLKDSDGTPLIEYPQYTKPAEYKGWKVPSILTSGNHTVIKNWRQEKAKNKTNKK